MKIAEIMNDFVYSANDVCAVVVSYNPEEILLDNVTSLIDQVSKCLIVDNGSSQRGALDLVKGLDRVEVIELSQNVGIASALNIGLEYCKKNAYQLMLSMDQDTILDRDAVRQLLEAMRRHASDSVGFNWDDKIKCDKKQSYLITSGNLVNTHVATKVGGYDEKLFIDSVDFDFSLRMKDSGCKLVKVAKAKGVHHLGTKTDKGLVSHSSDRYYFIFRNHFYLMRKYRWKHPIFIMKKNIALLMDMIMIALFDDEKKKKLSMLKKGLVESKSL